MEKKAIFTGSERGLPGLTYVHTCTRTHTHTHTHIQRLISTNIGVALYVNLQDPSQKKWNANNSDIPCSVEDFQKVVGSY